MKNITLTRNGQTAPRDVETSTMHADGLAVGHGVMLRIKGDCCPGMKPTPYKEYVVTAIKKTDRFGGRHATIRYVRFIRNGLMSRVMRRKHVVAAKADDERFALADAVNH